jgi:hypothetical protein
VPDPFLFKNMLVGIYISEQMPNDNDVLTIILTNKYFSLPRLRNESIFSMMYLLHAKDVDMCIFITCPSLCCLVWFVDL